MEQDRLFMREAIALAERGRGRTSPNPRVGAVLVRDGVVVGRGYHASYGGPHAEVNAIADAGPSARGSDLYVTLEPCCVWGKTPPCTEAILSAGVGRVVTPMIDPNPEVAGRGLTILREAGLTVETGCLEAEARLLNEPYIRLRATGLPLVTLKLAVTLDGRITTGSSRSRWISCEESRRRVHAMRAVSDAVLVGSGTVLADDPALTDRRQESGDRQPARIVADSRLRTANDRYLVRTAGDQPTIIACSDAAALDSRAVELEARGVRVWRISRGADGHIDARGLLLRAASEGMTDVLCEGGAALGTALLDRGLATRLAVFVAPKLAGESGLAGLRAFGSRLSLEEAMWEQVGDDVLLTARVRGAAEENDVRGASHGFHSEDVTTCSQG